MIDVESTIISQYANSPTITQLIAGMNAYIDPRADIDNFYNYVWNVETAQKFGLDIWGRIVGINRQIQGYIVEDDDYRKLILIKALSNILDTSAGSINQLLKNLFSSRGRAYVNHMSTMEIRYTFEFVLSDYEKTILISSGIMLRGAGVLATSIDTVLPVFGFSEAGTISAAPFDQAPFISEDAFNAIN